jgi:hypothetical protein
MTLILAAAPLTPQTLVRLWDSEITAEEVRRWDPSQPLNGLSARIEEMFEQQYLRENGLEPPPEAFSAVRKRFQEASSKLRKTTPQGDAEAVEKAGSQFVERIFVQRTVRSFYLSRALWKKHGGRIVLSAFGICVAKDGLVQEMRALERSGLLTFPGGADLRNDLYRYMLDQGGDGVISGERAREFLAKPPWGELAH